MSSGLGQFPASHSDLVQDGGTSFIWKTDSASAQGPLECSGVGVLGWKINLARAIKQVS